MYLTKSHIFYTYIFLLLRTTNAIPQIFTIENFLLQLNSMHYFLDKWVFVLLQEAWKKEKLELEEKIRVGLKLDTKNLHLQDQLKDAQETVVKYQMELQNYKVNLYPYFDVMMSFSINIYQFHCVIASDISIICFIDWSLTPV